MPRPPRRTRAVVSQAAAPAAVEEPAAKPAAKPENRRRTCRSEAAAPAEPSASSDHEGKKKKPVARQPSRQRRAAASASAAHARRARGPNESGIDIQDDDTFGDMNTSFCSHNPEAADNGSNLSDLSDLGDLDDFSDLGDLGSSPAAGSTTGSARGRRAVGHSGDNTAASTSSFNVGLFRRGRPRQSSVHSRDDAPIRPSSRGGPATPSLSSTFSLGTFRRRAREPSILGRRRRHTSRHSSRDRSGGEMSGSELESDLGGELQTSDAEAPSTALREHSAPAQDSMLSAMPANVTSVLMNRISRPARSTRSKKRKSEEAPREDELPKRRSLRRSTDDSQNILPSVETPLSLPPSTPPSQILRSADDRFRQGTTPPVELDPEILAPPASSGSSSASPFQWPSIRGLARAGGGRRGKAAAAAAVAAAARPRTPELVSDDENSGISSPPSLTHSPNYQRAGKPATRAKTSSNSVVNVKPLTTEALTALLPQRRHRARGAASSDIGDEDEADNSAVLGEDVDELAQGPAGRRRSTRSTTTTAMTAAAATTNRRAANGTKKKLVRRTYGSRSFSDKENQEADGSTFSPLPDNAFEEEETMDAGKQSTRKEGKLYFGEEVEKASKKFKEVDQWRLEFESVSRESSPVGAR